MENSELWQWIKYKKIHALAVSKPLNWFKPSAKEIPGEHSVFIAQLQ